MDPLWVHAAIAGVGLMAGAVGAYTAFRVRQAIQQRDSEHIARDVARLEARHAERFARLEARFEEATKDLNGIGRAMREGDDRLHIAQQAVNAKLLVIRQKVGLTADDLNISHLAEVAMARLFTMSQIVRTAGGLLLSLVGLGILLTDSYVAYTTRASAHGLNLAIGALLLWAGGYVLDPKYVTTMVGTLVSQVVPAIKAYMSGGSSSYFASSAPTLPPPVADPLVVPPPPGKINPPTFPPPNLPKGVLNMAQNFAVALSFTLGQEGGYHAPSAADPNPTNYGVTQATYDAFRDAMHQAHQPVKEITYDEVKMIYSGYWKGSGCEYVGPLTALTLFEMSVNGGIGTAAMMLQRCVGVKEDGVIGPDTIAAIQAVPDTVLAARFEFERLRRYLNIAEHIPREAPNFIGWVMRTVQYREQFLKPAGM